MSVAISEHMLPDGSTAVVGVQGTRVCVERRVGDPLLQVALETRIPAWADKVMP